MENNELNLMHLLEKKVYHLMRRNKVCHLIRKNVVEKTEDYTSSRVKLEKLHNSVNFENLICRFMGFTKNTDFNDFIDAETTFDDIKSQQISSKMQKKIKWNLNQNYLLNETREIIYFLYQAKEITKNVYSKTMNSIKLQNKEDTIFMNSEKSKIFVPYRLLLDLSTKADLKRSDKCVALSNLGIYYIRKNKKSLTKTINLKYQL